MQSDENQIRQLVATWHSATKAGDVDTVLNLMLDDAVFLVPERPPMRKAEFAAALRPQPGKPVPKFDSTSVIKEIQVAGDWAFMWTELSVVVTLPDSGQPMARAGHTLTVLKKVNDKWFLARDANLLGPVDRPKS